MQRIPMNYSRIRTANASHKISNALSRSIVPYRNVLHCNASVYNYDDFKYNTIFQ